MTRFLHIVLLLSLLTTTSCAQQDGYPRPVVETTYPCSHDNSEQKTLIYKPTGLNVDERVPLLVTLHTWSGDYQQTAHVEVAEWCIKKKWIFLHPNFRGPNWHPDACGSDAAVSDIRDAVKWAKDTMPVDAERVYLVGTSGGGYMSLLMAGRAPELWSGVSAWVPISDLAQWHADSLRLKNKYHEHMEKSCGGSPGTNAEVDREYRHRSPLTWLTDKIEIPIDINAGINDGHTGSVPVSHSLRAFNLLADPPDRIGEDAIATIDKTAAIPPQLIDETLIDKSYGKKRPLFRRKSGAARVTIFDGGHEIVPNAALTWLNSLD